MSETIKIKMLETVRPDLAGIIPTPKIKALKGEIYEAHVNMRGAVSVLIKDENEHLQMLGVKPGEFEFVEAPAWVLEKHGKLTPVYDELKLKCEKLVSEIELLRFHWQELCNKLLTELDKDGYCRLVVTREAVEDMLSALAELKEKYSDC